MLKLLKWIVIGLLLGAFDLVAADKTIDQEKVSAIKPKVEHYSDRFLASELWSASGKALGGGTVFGSWALINPQYMKSEKSSTYSIDVIRQGALTIYLNGQVIFLLDGTERINLWHKRVKTDFRAVTCTPSCYYEERFTLLVSVENMQRIANAKSVEVAIYGREGSEIGYFKPAHQAAFRAILEVGESNGGESGIPVGAFKLLEQL